MLFALYFHLSIFALLSVFRSFYLVKEYGYITFLIALLAEVVFLVPLSEYDLNLRETVGVNRMHESIQLFTEMCNTKYLTGTFYFILRYLRYLLFCFTFTFTFYSNSLL